MRRLLLVVLASSALMLAPARANHELGYPHEVVFEAPVPCSLACGLTFDPYDESPLYGEPCAPEPSLVPDSTDSIEVVAPEGAAKLRLEVRPAVDWDSFICSADGDELAIGANIFGELCQNALGSQSPVPVGCVEVSETEVTPGKGYVLLVYNSADPLPLPGTYTFLAA